MTRPLKSLLTIAAVGLASACGEDAREERPAETTRADLRENRVADDGESLTAQDQDNDDPDLAITRAIRDSVTSDDSLSVSARNVAIITEDSVVTLRGSVDDPAERIAVERHSAAVAGVARVDNAIVVDR